MSYNRGAKRTVSEYLMTNAGKPMASTRVERDTGLPRQSVNESLSALAREKGTGVERIGYCLYRYDTPAPEPETPEGNPVPQPGEVYECVGRDRDGVALVRSEAGVIYKLTEI